MQNELKLCERCKKNYSLFYRCDSCRKARYAARKKWPSRQKELKKRKISDRIKIRNKVLAHYSNGTMACGCCKENNVLFLTIDHINNDGAEHRRQIGQGGRVLYPWLIKNNFPPGYQVLCFNCNCGRARNGGICPHKTNPS